MTKDLEANLAVKEEKYLITIKTLRLKNFSNNLPFLMLSENLPEGQSYLEFPDGSMIIHEIFVVGSQTETRTIRKLTPKEADQIRNEYGLN
ncbi:hypothetical protein SAMN06265348_109305 [Pedobacter westerhofensis]|uniref:Uncharacterized protein n=1 Tax=Pedobacter westerhofensis TaxID=425512 RepID=A0A521EY52_9SPHI|nr:hypothetical protein [Pedobacter westerhofensis]SMO88878.1 hypothetical protein SAMN06265348_109305 [Pedobacter westerhofensis]